MSIKYDVITIGAATKDVFLVSDQIELIKSPRFSTGVAECVSLGSKIEVDELFVSSGGGATNTAAAFSKLGYKTACVTRIGNDSDGHDIKKELDKLGVETKTVITDKLGRTGYSTLLTASTGERTALVFRGASKAFTPKDIDWDLFSQTRWVYITSLGGNIELTRRIINTCRKNGVHIAWNPGMSEIEEAPGVILQLLEKDVHVFNVNREEAAKLTNEPQEHILKLFSKMSPDDNQIRIITDGVNGAYLCNGTSCYKSGTSQTKHVSRTGAGDAFGSGVVASLMRGDAIHMALKVGTFNAQSVIKSLGAKQGLITKFPTTKQLSSIPIETL